MCVLHCDHSCYGEAAPLFTLSFIYNLKSKQHPEKPS